MIKPIPMAVSIISCLSNLRCIMTYLCLFTLDLVCQHLQQAFITILDH